MNIFQSNKNCHPSFDFKSLSISPLIWTYDMSGHFSNLPELWLRACKVDRQVGMFSDRGEQTVFKVWSVIKRRIYRTGETQLLKMKQILNEPIFSHGTFAKDQAMKLVKSRLARIYRVKKTSSRILLPANYKNHNFENTYTLLFVL